jgi:hypothetical protein
MYYAGIILGIIVMACFTLGGTLGMIQWVSARIEMKRDKNADSFYCALVSLVLAGSILWFLILGILN